MTTFNFRKYEKAIYLLLVSMLFVTACTEQAPRIAKYTDLYAVKGTDSLFLDRYTAVSVEQDDARPCLVFVFGGGFIAGSAMRSGTFRSFITWLIRGTTWYRSTIVLV